MRSGNSAEPYTTRFPQNALKTQETREIYTTALHTRAHCPHEPTPPPFPQTASLRPHCALGAGDAGLAGVAVVRRGAACAAPAHAPTLWLRRARLGRAPAAHARLNARGRNRRHPP